jgi:uncharacterized small protein (DUF1192 family)
MDDDAAPKKTPKHEIGQDLALLSVDELTDRIAILNDEIARLDAARSGKRASLEVAAAVFRRG